MQKIYKNFLFCQLVLGFNMIMGVNAQNLVVNGSFENYNALPQGITEWYKCDGWNNVNMSTLAHYTVATPDYYNAQQSAGFPAHLPSCGRGHLNAHTGDGIMGFITYNSNVSNFREYLSSQLASPMVVGETYTVSFWLSNSDGTRRRSYGSKTNGIGVHFSTSPLTQVGNEVINVTPQLVIPGEVWNASWTLYSFSYTSTAAWQYITIGNYDNDASQTRSIEDPGAITEEIAYYFLDDIVVEAPALLPVELTLFEAESNNDVVDLNWITESEIDNDYFTVQRSINGIDWEELEVINGAGNSSELLNYVTSDRYPYSGVSYYRLKQTNVDGQFEYSKVRSVEIERLGNSKVNIYPNPTESEIKIIGTEDEIEQISVYNMFGQDVTFLTKQFIKMKSMVVLDLSNLSAGFYLIRTKTKTNRLKVM